MTTLIVVFKKTIAVFFTLLSCSLLSLFATLLILLVCYLAGCWTVFLSFSDINAFNLGFTDFIFSFYILIIWILVFIHHLTLMFEDTYKYICKSLGVS